MSDNQNQHFVPRSHLGLFSENGTRIWVYDKPTGKTFSNSVASIASENNFNELSTTRDPNSECYRFAEQQFAEIEGSTIGLIRDLSERIANVPYLSPEVIISDKERSSFAVYVLLQLLRTKEAREALRERMTKLATAVLHEVAPKPAPLGIDIEKWSAVPTEDILRAHHLRLTFARAAEKAPKLFGGIWVFGSNKTELPLWTSDHPVTEHISRPPSGVPAIVGISKLCSHICFPLSPAANLLILDRDGFAPTSILDGTVVELDLDQVIAYNVMQVEQSYRQVYSNNGNFFALAHQVCEGNPSLRILNKERFTDSSLKTAAFVEKVLSNLEGN
jgi:hypothetical protein